MTIKKTPPPDQIPLSRVRANEIMDATDKVVGEEAHAQDAGGGFAYCRNA